MATPSNWVIKIWVELDHYLMGDISWPAIATRQTIATPNKEAMSRNKNMIIYKVKEFYLN